MKKGAARKQNRGSKSHSQKQHWESEFGKAGRRAAGRRRATPPCRKFPGFKTTGHQSCVKLAEPGFRLPLPGQLLPAFKSLWQPRFLHYRTCLHLTHILPIPSEGKLKHVFFILLEAIICCTWTKTSNNCVQAAEGSFASSKVYPFTCTQPLRGPFRQDHQNNLTAY